MQLDFLFSGVIFQMVKQKPEYFDLNLQWVKTDDLECPYQTKWAGHSLQVRLNDFPVEAMFTLIVDGGVVKDFDDWPSNWKR